MASNEHSMWRSHCQEAKIGWPGGQRIPWNDEAMGSFLLPCAPWVSQIARGGLIGAPPRGQPWTSAVTLLPGRTGLIAWRMAVWWTFREPSLCRHVHRELLRSVWLDSTPIIAPTACHQRNYVERYSRSTRSRRQSAHPPAADHLVPGREAPWHRVGDCGRGKRVKGGQVQSLD